MTSTQEAIIKKYKELHEAEQMVEAGEVLKDLQSLQQTTEQGEDWIDKAQKEYLTTYSDKEEFRMAIEHNINKSKQVEENVGVDIEKTINYIMEDYQCSDGEADLEFILRKHLTPTASGEEKASEKICPDCMCHYTGDEHKCDLFMKMLVENNKKRNGKVTENIILCECITHETCPDCGGIK